MRTFYSNDKIQLTQSIDNPLLIQLSDGRQKII